MCNPLQCLIAPGHDKLLNLDKFTNYNNQINKLYPLCISLFKNSKSSPFLSTKTFRKN